MGNFFGALHHIWPILKMENLHVPIFSSRLLFIRHPCLQLFLVKLPYERYDNSGRPFTTWPDDHFMPYLVIKVTMKGEGSKIPLNLITWFMDDPITKWTLSNIFEISKNKIKLIPKVYESHSIMKTAFRNCTIWVTFENSMNDFNTTVCYFKWGHRVVAGDFKISARIGLIHVDTKTVFFPMV